LVNATFARKYFPQESPLGQHLRASATDPWSTIVGVVPDTLVQGPLDAQADGAGVFFCSAALPPAYATLVVRPRGTTPAARLSETLRREILRVDPRLAIYQLETPRHGLDLTLAQVRTVTQLFTLFGAVAMVLSAVGLYGVAAFSVSQRTQEFGIRMALGAAPRQIMRLVLRQGGMRFVIGAAAGLGLACAAAGLFGAANAALLYKVNPRDPVVYAAVFGLLALATLVACLVPARRATKV